MANPLAATEQVEFDASGSNLVRRVFHTVGAEEGHMLEQPSKPVATGLPLAGAALLGVGWLLSARLPARHDEAKRNAREERSRLRPRLI